MDGWMKREAVVLMLQKSIHQLEKQSLCQSHHGYRFHC